MKIRPPPRVGQEVYYVDSDKNLLRAIVTRVHMGSFFRDCPTGTCWEPEGKDMYIRVPEGTKWDEVKLPRGFEVDLEITSEGTVKVLEHVPFNPIERGQTRKDSLGANSWVFA